MRNSNVFFSIVFLIASAPAIFAQSFTFGPKFGLNMKDLQGPGAVGYSIRPDFNAGLAWNFLGNAAVNLGGEFLYSQQGGRLRNSVVTTSHTTLRYFSVPLTAKYYFWSQTRTTPFVFGGPQFSYLLNARNNLAGNITPQFNRLDVSGVFGAGLRMQMETLYWTLDLRFAPGISNVSAGEARVRNSVLSANTSFEFGSRKKARRGLH